VASQQRACTKSGCSATARCKASLAADQSLSHTPIMPSTQKASAESPWWPAAVLSWRGDEAVDGGEDGDLGEAHPGGRVGRVEAHGVLEGANRGSVVILRIPEMTALQVVLVGFEVDHR